MDWKLSNMKPPFVSNYVPLTIGKFISVGWVMISNYKTTDTLVAKSMAT